MASMFWTMREYRTTRGATPGRELWLRGGDHDLTHRRAAGGRAEPGGEGVGDGAADGGGVGDAAGPEFGGEGAAVDEAGGGGFGGGCDGGKSDGFEGDVGKAGTSEETLDLGAVGVAVRD